MSWESILGNISSEEHKSVLEMMLNNQQAYSTYDEIRPMEVLIEYYDE